MIGLLKLWKRNNKSVTSRRTITPAVASNLALSAVSTVAAVGCVLQTGFLPGMLAFLGFSFAFDALADVHARRARRVCAYTNG